MTKSWIFLICAIMFNTAGNLCMKQFSQTLDNSIGLMKYLSSTFIMGAIFFGINLIFYSKALEVLPLSVSYPVLVVASLCLVALASLAIFGERISMVQGIGLIVICFGIFLIGIKDQ